VLLPVRRGTHSGREGHAMDDTEPLGPGNESWLASIVADGTATKDDATRLLVEFVRQANAGQVSPRMIEHLRDCFAAFLVGKKRILPSRDAGRDAIVSVPIKSMEKAFGLVRISSGQPPIDADTLTEAAADLLEQRVAGTSHQDALANVAENRKAAGLQVTSETEIGAAWAKHKLDALIWLRASRSFDNLGWSREEMDRLPEIYSDVPGAVLPGEKMFEGRHAIPGAEHGQRVGDASNSEAAEFPSNTPK
jgi:hypothetical protein